MICQACEREAPTKQVAFRQNIGALLVRFEKTVQGRMCKDCIKKHFRTTTAKTLLLGWWGLSSVLITPWILVGNVFRYLGCLWMKPVPPGATVPVLNAETFAQIRPHAAKMFARLNARESVETVAREVAALSGTTPGQVLMFVKAAVQAQVKAQEQKAA